MSLLVGQIIYTSFPKIGFKSLVSQQIPLEIEQAFLEHIVHQYWNAYNPPPANYRAAYLHQLSPRQTLFGWLYNDGKDDIGRSHIPYFISYYLAERLTRGQLASILTCLEVGPLTAIEDHPLPLSLDMLTIPGQCRYQPTRSGVKIPNRIQQQSHRQLERQQLLQLFVPLKETEREIFSNKLVKLPLTGIPPQQEPIKPINIDKIENILRELAAKPIEIQGTALLSSKGQPLVAPIGLDENNVLILAGNMLYLAQNTQDELKWQGIEQIVVRAREGHLILTRCHSDAFLLVKAGQKALIGLLEGEINRTVKKLQDRLKALNEISNQPEILSPTPEVLPKVDEVLYELSSREMASEMDEEVRYRGRRIS